MIREVLRYPKGVTLDQAVSFPVVAFDENGDEILEFRGEYQNVRAKILARAPRGVKFFHSCWGLKGLEKQEVARKEW